MRLYRLNYHTKDDAATPHSDRPHSDRPHSDHAPKLPFFMIVCFSAIIPMMSHEMD